MRITDARSGRATEIRPRRAGLLRVTLDVGRSDDRFDLADLRVLLIGDVLARTAEPLGLQVAVRLQVPPLADDARVTALLGDADLLGIRPPAETATDPGRAADLVIGPRTAAAQETGLPCWPSLP
ncbi:hypothetical protein ACIQWA_06900 [Kitasatospora sp. NPDC098652]|uniref:hypothetical protein n=1 Tax=Kitasatospora sp. NPDC098652 TaxID=3364095 RepID=UPI003821249A